MVDFYRNPWSEDHYSLYGPSDHSLPISEPPRGAVFDAPKIDEETMPLDEPINEDNESNGSLHQLQELLLDGSTSSEALYAAYCSVPSPRIETLPKQTLQQLLQRLAVPKKRTEKAMFQYLSVLEDMKGANIPMHIGLWNSAVHLAGRCFSKVTAIQVESAIMLWKEMELEAGIRGNHVTFNILFDIAVRSQKFVLAEIILKEMRSRQLSLDRYSAVSIIYFHGVRCNADGVRSEYRKLVEDGHVVDTVVLNCVIASLLRAGEPAAAEHVYIRMREVCLRDPAWIFQPKSLDEKRGIAKALRVAGTGLKRSKKALEELQEKQVLAPDQQTFVILVRYHAQRSGELRQVVAMIEDMNMLGIPIHPTLFLEVFRGFSTHGGERYSLWSLPRLESVYKAFCTTVEERPQEFHVGKWMVFWILRAYIKCSNRARTHEVWHDLKTRWNATEKELDIAHNILAKDKSKPYKR
ncbi:hypothetical protein MMC25_007103 [Agyrium rufum]|nr:hypothetical protein [Agyrium rufum]